MDMDQQSELMEAEGGEFDEEERKKRRQERRERKRAKKAKKAKKREKKRKKMEEEGIEERPEENGNEAGDDEKEQEKMARRKRKKAAKRAKQKLQVEVQVEEPEEAPQPPPRSTTRKRSRSRTRSSNSSRSSSSSRGGRRYQSKSSARTYSSSDTSSDEKQQREQQQRMPRNYGPDASSWRMYEMEKEKALAKGLLPPSVKGMAAAQGAIGGVPTLGRNPNLVSTLRRPYLPGVGRRTSSIGLYGATAEEGGTGTYVPRGRGRGRGGMFIPGYRGRGRGRGRGRAAFRFYGPHRPKAEYLDERGQIDKKKLLEIATENATKLAMEGKLPKGEELLDAIKNKSLEQLATISKQMEEEQAREASRPTPFVKWMSSTFALAVEQQQMIGGTSPPPFASKIKRQAMAMDDTTHLMEKISSSEDEADKEEMFQKRHESWKQRTEKRAKEREADEAEEEGEMGAATARVGKPFKRTGPMRLGASEIKIKITPSQSSISSSKSLAAPSLAGSTQLGLRPPPAPPTLPPIPPILPSLSNTSTFSNGTITGVGLSSSFSLSSSSFFPSAPIAPRLGLPSQQSNSAAAVLSGTSHPQQQQMLWSSTSISSQSAAAISSRSAILPSPASSLPPPPVPPSLPPAPKPPTLAPAGMPALGGARASNLAPPPFFPSLLSSPIKRESSPSSSDSFPLLLPPPPAPPVFLPKQPIQGRAETKSPQVSSQAQQIGVAPETKGFFSMPTSSKFHPSSSGDRQ